MTSASHGETIRSHVVFRKQVSDGNYGTEAAEVLLVPLFEPYEMSEEAVAVTLEAARRLVHAELARSPSANVRRAVEAPKVAAGDDGRTGDDVEDLPF